MGQPIPASQPKETRVTNLREVSLGFAKKIAQDEARRCPQCAVATCLPGCPLGIDIPGFIRFLREGDAVSALERIKKDNPFPAICGRICPAPCEQACIFHADGSPIAIKALERYAADNGTSRTEKQTIVSRGQKVAIIGSGPAGMAAAYYLAQAGIGVTLFEAHHEPGGLLRYGIPEFRLPQKVLDSQFSQLKSMGVDIQTDILFGRTLMIDEIFMRGFNAVLLAVGASLPRFHQWSGTSLGGVYYDVEFLNRMQDRDKENMAPSAAMVPGPKTVIVGAGMAALDAGRLALRLGQQVTLVFAGLEEQMGVSHEVVQDAMDEGLVLAPPAEILDLMGDEEGFVSGLQCRKLEMVETSGGLVLQPAQEEPFVLEAQMVILANGQRPNDFLKGHLPQLKWDEDGSLWADGQTGMTNVDKIFACGNVVTGAGAVVDAIACGKSAGQKIIQYLETR